MSSARRLSALSLLMLTAAALLALTTAPPAAATPYQAPTPPGPVNGSGNFEGTESVLNETLGGPPCFFTNTKTIFVLRDVGTFAGVTAGGAPVAYTTSIGANQALYADGPVQIEVESTA